MYQIDETNLDSTEIILGETTVLRLRDLVPYPSNEVWSKERKGEK
jgi:hypothetical protein